MINPAEQISDLNQTSIETALRFAKISLDSAERLVRLQLDAAKEALEENAKNAKTLSGVKDVQDVVALRSKLAESSVEKALSYSRSVYEVASQTQSELSQLLEEGLSSFNKSVVTSVDKASKNAPAGSDVAVAALKSTVAATAAAVDSMTKAAKQVADFADASVKAATTATADAVKAAAKKS